MYQGLCITYYRAIITFKVHANLIKQIFPRFIEGESGCDHWCTEVIGWGVNPGLPDSKVNVVSTTHNWLLPEEGGRSGTLRIIN